MRQNTTINFDYDLESSSVFLSCAIDNLYLLRDCVYRDVFAMEEAQKFLGTGHLMSCCDAMTTAFRELERIKAGMDAAIKAELQKRKDSNGTA